MSNLPDVAKEEDGAKWVSTHKSHESHKSHSEAGPSSSAMTDAAKGADGTKSDPVLSREYLQRRSFIELNARARAKSLFDPGTARELRPEESDCTHLARAPGRFFTNLRCQWQAVPRPRSP